MAERVVIDPITRIEGHLRMELETDGGAITNAWSQNTQFRGLEMIVRASGELMEQRGLKNFAAGVIAQIAALLDLPPEGLICARETEKGEAGMQVIAAAGKYSEQINHSLAEIVDPEVRDAIELALVSGESCYAAHSTTLLLEGHGRRIAIYLENRHKIESFDRHLLEVFCANITIGFENTALYSKLHNLAYFDPLTGLPNRLRFLQEKLKLSRIRSILDIGFHYLLLCNRHGGLSMVIRYGYCRCGSIAIEI